jgi:hypothetical protein
VFEGRPHPVGSGQQKAGTEDAVKRPFRILGLGCCILAAVAGIVIWALFLRPPSINLLPLPDNLIAIESAAGRELIGESRFRVDYDSLTKNFVSQSRRAFCGVASSVVILNALRNPERQVTQSSFFTDSVSEIRGSLQVTFAGMSLVQLRDILRAHDLDATLFYASNTDVDTFRKIAQENLKATGDFLLVNYQRASLGQGKVGHISPVAAYHAGTDRLLVLDVAAYKYPPVWVSTDALWNAMNTVDRSSSHTRGFIVVTEGAFDIGRR